MKKKTIGPLQLAPAPDPAPPKPGPLANALGLNLMLETVSKEFKSYERGFAAGVRHERARIRQQLEEE